jgi:glycogen debranching enzyme
MTDQEIRDHVKNLLHKNMMQGFSRSTGIHFHYTRPSLSPYASQYFWDTCFHSFIFTALDEVEMAMSHIKSLFSLQQKDGFVGHIIYWNKILPNRITDIFQSRPSLGLKLFRTHSSALIQPPIVAQAVQNIFNKTRDLNFLQEIYPKLKKYFTWLAENRDFEGEGLLSIISPFESGMDWKPTFDEVVGFKHGKANWKLFAKVVTVDIRNFLHNYHLKTIYRKGYFIVKEVGFNTMYIQNLRVMSVLGKFAGDPESDQYGILAEKVLRRLMNVMYDEQDNAFYDVYGRDYRKIRVLTPTIFYPVVIDGLPDELQKKVLARHLFNKDEFEASFPIPSVAKNDPSFNPAKSVYIWRGPSWIVFNWFIYHFLKDRGYEHEAGILVDCIRSLIEKSGFREYYNPFTGEGYGAIEFTWTGLIADMLEKEQNSDLNKELLKVSF